MLGSSVDDQRAFVQGKGVAGIDVAQQWHYVRWLDPVGRFTGRAYRVENTRAGFELCFAKAFWVSSIFGAGRKLGIDGK